jgi:hypothetical protein
MVTPMSDELDPKLLALFAESHEPLHEAEFMRAFLAKLERARRTRLMWRIGMVVAVVLAAVWIMPAVLDETASVVRTIGEESTIYAPLLVSPWGWVVSTLIGLVIIFRTGAMRRR